MRKTSARSSSGSSKIKVPCERAAILPDRQHRGAAAHELSRRLLAERDGRRPCHLWSGVVPVAIDIDIQSRDEAEDNYREMDEKRPPLKAQPLKELWSHIVK